MAMTQEAEVAADWRNFSLDFVWLRVNFKLCLLITAMPPQEITQPCDNNNRASILFSSILVSNFIVMIIN
jgi:hypothetical protein